MVVAGALPSPTDSKLYVQENISPTLIPALTALARARPADPVTWLAEHLLETKPLPPATKAAQVELVLVLGSEVSGKTMLCDGLVETCTQAGQPCQHLELSSLLKAEISSSSAFGVELSTWIQQGKMIPKAALSTLVKNALADAPPGLYLLTGYPTSLPMLQAMEEEVGHAPSRALLLDAAIGAYGPGAEQKMKSYSMQTRGVVKELEEHGMLKRLDTQQPADAVLSQALATLMR